jgi:hypothetical protein
LNQEAPDSYKIIYSKLDHPERTCSGPVGITAGAQRSFCRRIQRLAQGTDALDPHRARTTPLRIQVIGCEEAVDP